MSILVSAHNPMTGPRHLGHHVSTMREWPRLQSEHECFFVIDDLIAVLMYPKERQEIFERSLFVAQEFLACGIDSEKASVFLTSMTPEVSELMVLLSGSCDQAFCDMLFRDSFLGILGASDREELALPALPSVAEYLYPQLALPALTLGLGADVFQGGEEISGYVTIMRRLVDRFNAEHGKVLAAPRWERPETSFLLGTDGTHMMSANAIYMSEPPEQAEQASRYQGCHPEAADEICSALTGKRAGEAATDGDRADELRSAIDRECAPYRSASYGGQDILEQLSDGAARAKFLLRETLSKVKRPLGIPEIIEY